MTSFITDEINPAMLMIKQNSDFYAPRPIQATINMNRVKEGKFSQIYRKRVQQIRPVA